MQATLSATGKQWNIADDTPRFRASDSIEAQTLIAHLLRARGIDPRATATLVPASVYPEGRKAAERIKKAIIEDEHIALFGDYDCDGITGVAQLVRYFQRHDVQPLIKLPHRVRDGYGLQDHQVEEFIHEGVRLVITVDTGVASLDQITKLQQAGIDVIVTDHHHVPEQLPPAYAIVHPALAEGFPQPHPAGAGVAYALIELLEGGQWDVQEIDQVLAMIGTVADLVELKGHNRALVERGLKACNTLGHCPLRTLIEDADIDRAAISSTDVGFRIAPRINAAGRIAEPRLALDALLLGGTAIEDLRRLNDERKRETQESIDSAIEELGLTEGAEPPPLIAIRNSAFSHGILGLIASRLTEAYGRPTLVATEADGKCTASLRSPKAYHITEGLHRCSSLLESCGGHAQAAGCTVCSDQWETFVAALQDDVRQHTTPEDLQPQQHIDAVCTDATVPLSFCALLELLEPYGSGNSEPQFLLPNVQLQNMRTVGADQSHLQAELGNSKVIGFRMGHLLNMCTKPVDIVCTCSVDEWQGRQRVQLQVRDMRPAV